MSDNDVPSLPAEKVRAMIDACGSGNLTVVEQLASEHPLYCRQQDWETGVSPLMVAAQSGNATLVQRLLDQGAPWNALDRNGRCAGDYATDAERWDVVNLLVEFATRAELILGELQRSILMSHDKGNGAGNATTSASGEESSSTKPSYLQHRLRYTTDGTALLDEDNDAVMMEWERPLMNAHASILMNVQEEGRKGDSSVPLHHSNRSVLNVGFGMGIIDMALQNLKPSQHHIIEAHPDVYQRMLKDGWDRRPGVHIHHGKWQDVIPRMLKAGVTVDAIFFDTYAEHANDMEDFHRLCLAGGSGGGVGSTTNNSNNNNNNNSAASSRPLLSQPNGIYSFFNGLAPDNLFFHGVACNVIKLQLSKLGLDVEFLQCQMQAPNDNAIWQDVRRRYWHGRDVYYLPKATWNQEFLGRKTKARQGTSEHVVDHDNGAMAMMMDGSSDNGAKRQRRID